MMRIDDGRRVHRAALAGSPGSAAAADEVGEEEEELHDGRTAGPRPWRTLHCNRGKKKITRPRGGRRGAEERSLVPGEEGGRAGRAAARGDASTAAASGPLEVVATFHG